MDENNSSQNTSKKKNSKSINLLSPLQYLILLPISLLMRLWTKTLRIEVPGELKAFLHQEDRPPAIILFWHNRLFMIAEAYLRIKWKNKIYGLVSASKDGSWLAAFFKLIGIGAIRGSSSFRGSIAIKALLKVLEQGNDIAITPDGPSGPCYDVKAGPLLLARKSKAPLWLCSCSFSSAWRLKSWDRFYIPKPFSKIILQAKLLTELEEIDAANIQAQLLEITEDLPD